jgi:hypothetical protein
LYESNLTDKAGASVAVCVGSEVGIIVAVGSGVDVSVAMTFVGLAVELGKAGSECSGVQHAINSGVSQTKSMVKVKANRFLYLKSIMTPSLIDAQISRFFVIQISTQSAPRTTV